MKIISKIFSPLLLLFVASPVYADLPPALWGTYSDPTGVSVDGILSKVLSYLFPIAGIACVIFIIIGGYTWIVSAGDPAKVKQAQGTLTWAIIGLIFVLIAALVITTLMDAVK
jgi:hypothetical protein